MSNADSLTSAFLLFARSALARLASKAQALRDAGQEVNLRSGGMWRLVADKLPSLWEMEEAKECARRHLGEGILEAPKMSDASGTSIPTPTFEQICPWLVEALMRPVMDAVEASGTLDPSDGELLDRHRRYVDDWTRAVRRSDFLIPLMNFSSEVEEQSLETLKLSRLGDDQKAAFWNLGPLITSYISFVELSEPTYQLTTTVDYRKGESADTELGRITDETRLVVTALRLAQPGDVGVRVVYRGGETPRGWKVGAASPILDFRVRERGQRYTLKGSDMPVVLRLFEQLKTENRAGRRSALHVALRRFNSSYAREEAEDRLIDLSIALEASLLVGIREELAFRLSLRGATLVREVRDPEAVGRLLRAMYDGRSAIVHDGRALTALAKDIEKATGFADEKAFVAACEDVVRAVLTVYLARVVGGESLVEINRELDGTMLKRLKP